MATDYKFRITAKDQTKGAFNSVNRNVNSTQAAMKKLAGAFAGVFAVRQLVMFGQESLQLADNIAEVADKLGLTTDFLQRMQFAAEQTGIATTTLNMGLQRFIRRVAEARNGTGEAKAALEQLGIALNDSEGNARSIEDILADVSDGLANTADSGEKVRLAFKFFDSEGVSLVSTLGDGSKALDALMESATGVIPDETIRNAQEFNDIMGRLKRQVLVPLQSAFINTASAILDFAEAMGLIKPDLFTKSMDELKAMLQEAEANYEKHKKAVEAHDAFYNKKQMAHFKEQKDAITEAIARKKKADEIQKKLNKTLDDGTESSDNFNNSFKGVVDDNVTVVKTFAETVEGQLTNAFTDFFDFANKEFMDFKNLATNVAQAVINELIQIFVVKKLVGMVQGSISSFTESFQGGTGASVDLTGGKLDAMGGAATQVQTASPTVNFNISTVDAQGFDQLLTSRKGTITTIINDAMNTQGKMGII